MINPEKFCDSGDPFVVALVTVSANNSEARTKIRRTWGNATVYNFMKTVFLIGNTFSQKVNDELLKESKRFGDIVQENFPDTFENVVLKTVMGFKWATNYCTKAKVFLKIDDDVDVNMVALYEHVWIRFNNQTTHHRNKFVCIYRDNIRVNRDPKNRFYVPKSQYESAFFPRYCLGKTLITNNLLR